MLHWRQGPQAKVSMLTRQNRKGNVEASSPKFCPPPGGGFRLRTKAELRDSIHFERLSVP
jgi:hypothetical protein